VLSGAYENDGRQTSFAAIARIVLRPYGAGPATAAKWLMLTSMPVESSLRCSRWPRALPYRHARAQLPELIKAQRTMSKIREMLWAVHDALERADIPRAVGGGAIALAYCTLRPRGTRDLDF